MARHSVQQFFVDLIRVAVEHPQPFHAGNFRRPFQQLRQLGMADPVDAEAGGILSHQNVLLHAFFRQRANFVQHVLHFPGTEAAPDQGDGAVGAAVVTAVSNADVGGIGRGGQHPAAGQNGIIPAAEALALAVQGRLQRLRQTRVLAHAHQQIDLRHIGHELFFVALGQTARSHQHLAFAGALVFGHLQQSVDALLLGGVDEAAGVDDQHLRFLFICGNGIAVLLQDGEHQLRIHPVFAAAKGNHADCGHSGRLRN